MGESPAGLPPLNPGTTFTRSRSNRYTGSRAEEALLASSSSSSSAAIPFQSRAGGSSSQFHNTAGNSGTHRRQRSLSIGSAHLSNPSGDLHTSADPSVMTSLVMTSGHHATASSAVPGFDAGLYSRGGSSSLGMSGRGSVATIRHGLPPYYMSNQQEQLSGTSPLLPGTNTGNRSVSSGSSAAHPLGRYMHRGTSQQQSSSLYPSPIDSGTSGYPSDLSSSYSLSGGHASFTDLSIGGAYGSSRNAGAASSTGGFPLFPNSQESASLTGDESSLYVSPKLIMSGPTLSSSSSSLSSTSSTLPWLSKRGGTLSSEALPPLSVPSELSLEGSSFSSLRRRNSRSTLSRSNTGPSRSMNPSSLNFNEQREGMFAPGMNVFDSDWELPSPMSTGNISNQNMYPSSSSSMSISRPGSTTGEMSSVYNSGSTGSLYTDVGLSAPRSGSYGLSSSSLYAAPSMAPLSSNPSSSYIAEGAPRASSSTIYIPPYPTSNLGSTSTLGAPSSRLETFQYMGHASDAGGYPDLTSQSGFNSGTLSGSALTADPFSTSYSPRPSSEPLPASAPLLSSHSGLVSSGSLLDQRSSAYAAPDLPSLESGYYSSPASRRGSAEATMSPVSPRSGVRSSARRPLTASGLATSAFPSSLSSMGALSADSLPPLPDIREGLGPLSESGSQIRSPRRLRSTGQLLSSSSSSSPSHSLMLPSQSDTMASNEPSGSSIPSRSYGTRTRQNMQGLIHSSDAETLFPGEWADAFR